MASKAIYVADSDSLINLHRHFGSKAIRVLQKKVKDETLKLPEGVVREILRGTDALARFVKECRQNLEVNFGGNSRLSEELAQMERKYGQTILVGTQKYPGFWHSKAGRKSADAQVVAAAKFFGWTVVSNDQAVGLACSLEGVVCIGWAEFARILGLTQQLRLFEERGTDQDADNSRSH